MERGAWQAIVHTVVKSLTRLKLLSTAQRFLNHSFPLSFIHSHKKVNGLLSVLKVKKKKKKKNFIYKIKNH